MASRRKKTAYFNLPDRKRVIRIAVSLGVFASVLGFFAFIFLIHDMPDLDNLETKGRRASVIFESYDGKTIATYGDLFRRVVKVDKLPRYVGEAVIAIEDRRFYRHCGVDLGGLLRAMATNLISGRIVQGGSTLTQQLAKNLFLSPSRSIKRKVQEFVLAIWLERKFSKKQILSIYLNRVYFGAGAYGIDAAAYRFFGKTAEQLTLYEAAKLAGVLKSPTSYSPFHNSPRSDQRTSLVLSLMVEAKYISENEMKEALLEKNNSYRLSILMDENRYFTDWALEQIQGIVGVEDEDVIVRTTLDSRLQKNATYIIRKTLNEVGFKNGVHQMALAAMDKTGAVRAMVGGHTYGISQYNRALAQRSFGSAFKYFVFLTALEKGVDVNDHISDMPISIGNWSPKNYHYKSIGSVTVTEAFVKSINTCVIRLAQKVGMDAVIRKAEELGITSEIDRNYASALGASCVNLLEITACYGASMTDGVKVSPFGIISIKNQRGKMLYRAQQRQNRRVISPEGCRKMKLIMRELMERGTGRRARLPMVSYGKTGTSNDSRDASFIGFSPPLVTGVWAGNDDNTPMNQKMTGGVLPAAVWRDFMLSAFGYGDPVGEVRIETPSKKPDSAKIDVKRRKINKPMGRRRISALLKSEV
ncbi:MAG: PBP1A family penicillin-binding protein [Holosporaceae bacterium]|jgi:penicillin-binding protein 1A|nr:PBP1A family penicillin-binding protein [Holosporaceae bacterium]